MLKADLEQTVTAQQAYFSTISKGALSRLKQGDADLGCGTQEGFDVDGAVDIQGGNGGTSGRFGSDSYHCQSGVRRILDGSFSLTHTDDLGTQALVQFAQQRERFASSFDSSFDCGLGLGLSRDVIDLRRGLSFSFSLDYDHIDERDRLSLGFSRERRFADDQGAIVTRLSMPSREALTLEHGIRLDF